MRGKQCHRNVDIRKDGGEAETRKGRIIVTGDYRSEKQ